MAYSDFTLATVRRTFSLQIDEQTDLFTTVPPGQPSASLLQAITETAHLASVFSARASVSWCQPSRRRSLGGAGKTPRPSHKCRSPVYNTCHT